MIVGALLTGGHTATALNPKLMLVAVVAALVLAAPAQAAPPPVKHVFVIVLENKNFDETFAEDSKAPYLSKELTAKGQFLTQYYATTHLSLGNYLAMISGQGPNPQVQADCQFFTEFAPATPAADGQFVGSGCVYPAKVETLAGQLEAKGYTWKGYMEDMGTPCRHPEIGARDDTQSAEVGDQYAARHNPFVYFHAIIDKPTCAANNVPLDRLPADLGSRTRTANYNFITPNLCNDGHDAPCVDGAPGGLISADAFLRKWVPLILASPAYREDGLLIVTFDEAEAEGEHGDATACCNEKPGPNTPNPGGPIPGPGGGRIGAVVLSPFVEPGTRNDTPYNHYSLLRSTEDIFRLAHLGFAGQDGLKPFGDDVFNRRAAAGCTSTRIGSGPITRRSLIGSVRVRAGRRLYVRMAHAATLKVTVGKRTLLRKRMKACRTELVRLPKGGRRAVVRASVKRGSEVRKVGYRG